MTKLFVLTDAQATAIHQDNAVRLCLIAYVQCPTDKTAVDVVKAIATHVRAENAEQTMRSVPLHLQIAAQAILDRWNIAKWEWAKQGATAVAVEPTDAQSFK